MRILKWLTVVAALICLTACSPSMSKLSIKTDPPGGRVHVLPVGVIVPDGGSVELPNGEYNFRPYQVPNSPGDLIVKVKGADGEILVPIGPLQLPPAQIEVLTSPPGGKVLIVETNRMVLHGDLVTLPAGRYTLQVSMEGYRPKPVTLDVVNGRDESVLVDCGKGFAELDLTSKPVGAEVLVDSRSVGKTPLTFEVEQGAHQISLALDGYFPAERQVFMVAGEDQPLNVALKVVPTAAPVKVVTAPQGGKIMFRGKMVGVSEAKLGRLAFGTHQVKGVKLLSDQVRLVGKKSFSLKKDQPVRVKLSLDQRERLFDGKWLPDSEALSQEQARYDKQRISKPLLVEIAVTSDDLSTFSDADALATSLQMVLRVGDAAKLSNGSQSWTFWKRYNQLTAEFRSMAAALFANNVTSLPWQKESSKSLSPTRKADLLSDLTFSLHRSRSELALLDLHKDQLVANQETVIRCTYDGPLTIVVAADQQPELPGEVRQIGKKLWVAEIAAGDVPVTVAWKNAPERLLVIGDVAAPFGLIQNPSELRINEKQILPIADGVKVERLVRISEGPDYETPRRQIFESSGPLAGQIDYSIDEVGPNDHFGDFRRTWLVGYKQGSGLTQRQVATSYQVVDQKKDFGSDQFLRRSGLDGKKAN